MLGNKFNIRRAWKRYFFVFILYGFLLNISMFSTFIDGENSSETSNTQEPENTPRSNIIISKDTTWTLANSPYNLTGNVLVEHNVTLTIDPGVVVRLRKGNYIQVEGKLVAEGTAKKMITITSIKGNPSKNDYWDSIIFTNNANIGSSIRYCEISYANYAIYVDPENPTWAPYQNAPNITYCNIFNCKNRLYFDTRHWSISLSKYANIIEFNRITNGLDIFIHNANVSIKNNYIKGGVGCILDGGNLEIINNSISGGENGIYCHDNHYTNLLIKQNLITGHSGSGISLRNFAYETSDYYQIENNTIIYNGKGIELFCYPYKLDIIKNTIRNNKYGIFLPKGYNSFYSYDNHTINFNNILNNSLYNIKNRLEKLWGDWDLENNWWGTTNSSSINQSIYDFYDDFNLGKILYKPFLTKEVKIYKPYNLPPVADAGPDKNGVKGEPVTFDGSNSTDPNNKIVSGIWDFGDGNTSNYISNETYNEYQISHTYEKPGNYTATLTVFDGLLYDTDTCWVNVSKHIIPNYPPSLYISPVEIYEDSYLHQLDLYDYVGDDRTPVEWLNFSIVNITNPKCGVTLESKRYITIRPAVNWYGNATVTIRVDDGELNSTFDLQIIVFPVREPPMVDTGGDQYAKVNTTVTFDGSGSYDNDGDTLTYNWSFGDGTFSGWQKSSNTTHVYNKTGIYKLKLTVNDSEFSASDTCIVWIYLNVTNKPPVISLIPDMAIRYYNPLQQDSYPGYGYDFSYFIKDKDNKISELTINAIPVESALEEYIEMDENNNMRLIFKFPFELVDGKKHPIYLYVKDLNPNTTDVYRTFNITLIIDEWPVELVSSIPDQVINEDSLLEDAFNIRDYFYERDTGTTYEIINQKNGRVRGKIDNNENVDLYSDVTDWYGTEELVIHAHDTRPEQHVYAVFNVTVKSVNDPPKFLEIPNQFVIVGEQKKINLDDYIIDVDTEFSKLEIETSDHEHTWINGSELYFKYDKEGRYSVTITVIDGEITVSYALEITVKEGDGKKPYPIEDTDDDGIPDVWERKYGLDPNNSSDAVLDLDNDSLSNLEEYKKDTDPTNHDTDGDGYSDKVDEFPNDPLKYKSEAKAEESQPDDQMGYVMVILLVIVIIILFLVSIFIYRRRAETEPRFTPDDELYSKVMHDILFDYQPNGEKLSNDELRASLDEKLKNGQISQETYNYMIDLIQNMEVSQQIEK